MDTVDDFLNTYDSYYMHMYMCVMYMHIMCMLHVHVHVCGSCTHCVLTHENLVAYRLLQIPKPKGLTNHPIACSGKPNLQQKAEPPGCLTLGTTHASMCICTMGCEHAYVHVCEVAFCFIVANMLGLGT